ncbi:hypothetical protein RJ639_008299, partial [Escallonia herrerae]
MALRNHKLWRSMMTLEGFTRYSRSYSSKPTVDSKKLRSTILKRINDRAKYYPVKGMVPVANEVLMARTFLIRGVSTLFEIFPVWACKYSLRLSPFSLLRLNLRHCPEVYIGEKGHLIRSCGGFRHHARNQPHEWIKGSLKDILVPVEAFHLGSMFQNVVKHNERFDFERVSAVVELCLQAGADPTSESLSSSNLNSNPVENAILGAETLSPHDLTTIAGGTLRAWETLRSGVKKLLLVYPVKVCKHCSEVHVGLSGHKARLCGVFRYESWRGAHFWKKAEVDDLVPPKVVWSRRPQDPPVLVDEGRNFYGHAPAVVDLSTKAGVIAPSNYFCMMKVHGLPPPTP